LDDALNAFLLLQVFGCLSDDCSVCKRQPDYPTLNPLRATVARHDQALTQPAASGFHSTDRLNDREAKYSFAKAIVARMEYACIP
jgi:hypothetical protein